MSRTPDLAVCCATETLVGACFAAFVSCRPPIASADPWDSRFVVWESLGKPKCKEQVCVTWFLFTSTTTLGRHRATSVGDSCICLDWYRPHAKRICRHAWPDVLVLNGDEDSPASAVFSIRSSHPYVKWVIILAGCSTSGQESLRCENKSGQGVSLDGTQLHRKWPSVRCASLLEGSIHLSLHARVSNVLEARVQCVPFRTREVILVLVPCATVLGVSKHFVTRSSLSPHSRTAQRRVSARILDFLPHQTATAIATSARKQALSVLNAHVWLFSRIRIPLGQGCGLLELDFGTFGYAALSVSNDCTSSLTI